MPDPKTARDSVGRSGGVAVAVAEAVSADLGPSEVQVFYSRLLGKAALAALVAMLLTYVLYSSGAVASKVPPGRVSECWRDTPSAYNETVGLRGGWAWVTQLGRGECLSRLGPALLGLVTIACFAVALPVFLRKRDWAFAAIVAAEIAVLALSASGLFAGGH